MFTGIVHSLGHVIEKCSAAFGEQWWIRSSLPARQLKPGTSILVNGVCLTVERYSPKKKGFRVSLAHETLKRTCFAELECGHLVHLEPSLTLETPLAGHFVLGHVDFTASVLHTAPQLHLAIPLSLLKYFPEKASVTVHGVSLTVARRLRDGIEVALIPETLRKTLLGNFKKGDRVHIEIDVLARYCESLLHP